eukprot:Lankesteria_metandrocarpae@DN680_c0_g1_i1.p1
MSFKFPTSVASLSQSIANLGVTKPSDGRFFQTTKRGEIQELKDELHSAHKDRKKEAVKKVIAAMTVGKDVSNLFADVVNCMQTTNIELKKLVYLYVINYSKAQPELAILAVNTFRKDSLDHNPLIRALAVRTMGCIRLEQITDYLVEPLRRACKDQDPYVRKTAAICVAKLHDTSPDTVQDQGFIEILNDLLGDPNPMVVANSVVALAEISETTGKVHLKLTDSNMSKLLNALNECTEWGQVCILDAISKHVPRSPADAEEIIDRVAARLSHANAAVVMSTIKVILKLLDFTNDAAFIRQVQKKLSAPLVTLLSSEPEIQYVTLRNISLIAQRRPGILVNEVKMFFCKYNDPIYVKLEKLDIVVRLVNERNIDQVLSELKEYAMEVDVDFVRKSIRAIGRCAIKLSRSAQRCIDVLLELIQLGANYVVQEVIVVVKDIFRKYPQRYEQVIAPLCENLESLDEPEAKASMIWIIGEYAEKIENADELLDSFLDGFHDEPSTVQFQILTAGVKLFLKSPKIAKTMVTRLLKMSTEESENPDLRDRGYIYWRLLSTNPDATKAVVLSAKPQIQDDSFSLETTLLNELIESISMLSSVYQKPAHTFAVTLSGRAEQDAEVTSDSEDGPAKPEDVENQMRNAEYSSGDDRGADESDSRSSRSRSSSHSSRSSASSNTSSNKAHSRSKRRASSSSSDSGSDDLLGLGSPVGKPQKRSSSAAAKSADASIPLAGSTAPVPVSKQMLMSSTTPGAKGVAGLEVHGAAARINDEAQLHLTLINASPSSTIGHWALQINQNPLGLAPASELTAPELQPGSRAEVVIPLQPNKLLSKTPLAAPLILQIAIRTSLNVFYMNISLPLSVIFVELPQPMDKVTFKNYWDRLHAQMGTAAAEQSLMVAAPLDGNTVKTSLRTLNMFFVSSTICPTHESLLFSSQMTTGTVVVFEVCLQNPEKGNGVKITYRSDTMSLRDAAYDAIRKCLRI